MREAICIHIGTLARIQGYMLETWLNTFMDTTWINLVWLKKGRLHPRSQKKYYQHLSTKNVGTLHVKFPLCPDLRLRSGRCPDWQCLLGALLPWAWHPAGWPDAQRQDHWRRWWCLQHVPWLTVLVPSSSIGISCCAMNPGCSGTAVEATVAFCWAAWCLLLRCCNTGLLCDWAWQHAEWSQRICSHLLALHPDKFVRPLSCFTLSWNVYKLDATQDQLC